MTGTAKQRIRNWTVQGGKPLQGVVRLPGDKSISHRAVILAALADGEVTIKGFSPGQDVLDTLKALEKMGIETESKGKSSLRIFGRGLQGLYEPRNVLDLGNSGTSMRLLSGILAGQPFVSVLTGDPYLRRRPMDRIVYPLRKMGANIDGRKNGTRAPLLIRGSRLSGIEHQMQVVSAQVKSCLLLASLNAEGETVVIEKEPTRDHTERMLGYLGADIHVEGNAIRVSGAKPLIARELSIPGDFSSAAFFIVAATLVPGSDLLLENVGINPGRIGLLTVLNEMGADIEITDQADVAGEPVADLHVRYAPLSGIEIPPELIASLIDEVPALAVAASFAEGTTSISEAGELRVKESDRLATVAANLGHLGVHVSENPDGLVIEGQPSVEGGRAESYGDHRIAMAMVTAALCSEEPVIIEDVACVDTSFPGFVDLMHKVGVEISENEI